MTPGQYENKHRRPVGAGLSLDKFASLGVSKFDKRKKLERLNKQKIIQHSKYKKLKQKLEAQGVLVGAPVKDSVAELEALEDGALLGSGGSSDDAGDNLGGHPSDDPGRAVTHKQACPSSKKYSHDQAGGCLRQQARIRTLVTQDAEVPRQGARAKHVSEALPTSDQAERFNAVPSRGTSRHASGSWKRTRMDCDETAVPGQPRRPEAVASKRLDYNYGHKGHLGQDSGKQLAAAASGSHEGEAERDGRGKRGVKRPTQLQRLAQRVADEKAEKERAKEAAMKEREERMKKLALAEKLRKEQKQLHSKRNAKGQPLMRYRMDKLLSQLDKSDQ